MDTYKVEIPELVEAPWPSEPGWYWFWGDPFCNEYNLAKYQRGEMKNIFHPELPPENPWKPELYSVRVFRGGNGPVHVFGGHFPDNHLPGLWAKALVPEVPNGHV